MIDKKTMAKVQTAAQGRKRKGSRTSTQTGSAQNLRQRRTSTDAAVSTPARHLAVQTTSSVTTAAPLQPLSKYKQVAESGQKVGAEDNLVVTA